MKLILLLILFFSALIDVSHGQSNPCDITYRNKGEIKNAKIMGVYEDLVLVQDKDVLKIVNADKFAKIRFDNGTYKWVGAGVGAGVGFLGGIFAYSKFNIGKKDFFVKDPTLFSILCAIPMSVIGYFIGNAFRNIDNYDLEKLNTFTKAKEINFIMKDHSKYR